MYFACYKATLLRGQARTALRYEVIAKSRFELRGTASQDVRPVAGQGGRQRSVRARDSAVRVQVPA